MARYEEAAYWNSLIRMSLSRFFILRVLKQRPMYGYEITERVKEATGGCCAPTEGTIYPVLRELEDGGYVDGHPEVVFGRERRVYALTEKGQQAYDVAASTWYGAASIVMRSVQGETVWVED